MTMVRTIIPDMVGGVSRQPHTVRFRNQMQECTNTFIHLSTGLEKRQGSDFVANITDPTGDVKIHWVDRSVTERFIFIFKQDGTTPLYIYTVDGTACSITYDAGTITELKAYLNTAPANIRAVSFDDTTIVLNRSTTTAVSASTTSYLYPASTGTEVDVSSNPHNKLSWEEFDLPPTATGEYWYARDDALGHPAGYYISLSTTTQPWYERVQTPYAQSAYDPDTMPIRIVQTGATTFTVEQIPWKPRYSGDSITNAPASFVGKTISDICIHRNRLWMSAGENVVGSQIGDYYNFWNDTYTQISDTDVIDVRIGSSQVSTIEYLVPFNKAIVIFTDGNQQFEIRSREALTPSNVAVIASTAYTSPKLAKPIIVGSQLYWCANKGAYTQVYEYISDDAAVQSVATDVAAHVDGYINKDMIYMSASSASDLGIMVDGASNSIYALFMYWQGERKLQNAWCKFVPADSGTVLSAHIFQDLIYTLHRSDSVLRINKIETRYSDAYPSYKPRIDSQRTVTGVWDKPTKTTTFTTPVNTRINAVFLGSDWGVQEGVWIEPTSVTTVGSDSVVVVSGDWTDYDCIVGCNYESKVELSTQYVRDQNEVPYVGTLQLKNASLYHRNTGYFEFQIDPDTTPSSTRILKYTGKTVGSSFIASQNSLSDFNSKETFKVMGSSDGVVLSIVSSQPSPMNITNIEFNTNFVQYKTSPADR